MKLLHFHFTQAYLSTPHYFLPMTIEVIVASLPRTGTTSIKGALELLGYNEIMHMLSCKQNSELRQAWTEIYANHLERTWTNEDWRHFFDKRFPEYVAGADCPFSDFALEIARAYPNAKVCTISKNIKFLLSLTLPFSLGYPDTS
jgi:hypothetical protein